VIWRAKREPCNSLLGSDLSTALQATTVVPRYINYTVPTPGTDADNYFQRNPLAPLEAMNVDFENLPSPIGTRNATGFLTPAGGVSLGSGARYFAKITDPMLMESFFFVPWESSGWGRGR
jgi:hypothetical protein